MTTEQHLRGNHLKEESEGDRKMVERAKLVWLEELGEAAQVARKRAEWRNFVSALSDTWRRKEQW